MAKDRKSDALPSVVEDDTNDVTPEVLPDNITDRFDVTRSGESQSTVPAKRLSTVDLANIESFDDAWAAVEQTFGDVRSTEDLGDGFNRAEKDSLVGVPFLILTVAVSKGDFGPFVVVRGITEDSRKVFFTDGSTGIRDQMMYLHERTGRMGGYMVKGGLVRSDYTYTDEQGRETKAHTFYLSTSA